MVMFTYIFLLLSHRHPIFFLSPPHSDLHSGDHTSWLLKQLFFFFGFSYRIPRPFSYFPPFLRLPGPFLFFSRLLSVDFETMAYEVAMLVLSAVGIVPGIILAIFAVAGVCFPNYWLGKKTRAPFSPGTPQARDVEANIQLVQQMPKIYNGKKIRTRKWHFWQQGRGLR